MGQTTIQKKLKKRKNVARLRDKKRIYSVAKTTFE